MNKIIKIILLVVVIVVSFYYSYMSLKSYNLKKLNNTQIAPGIEGLIIENSFDSKIKNIEDLYVKFDVKYPFFNKADRDFNYRIENLINEKIAEHKTISEENWNARYNTQSEGENIPKVPSTDDEKFTFFSGFEIVQSNGTYISFVLKYGGYSGGAHGYENIASFNYDMKNQKNIELKDLFSNNPEYLVNISTKSRELLKNEFAVVSEEDMINSSEIAIKEYIDNIVSMIESGTEPKEENFSTFTFTPDKIKLYFAQYQVGPYAIGMPKIQIDRK